MSIKIASMNFGDCDTILHNTPNGMKNIAEVLGPNGEVYWSATKELTGIPPLSIRSNGTMLLDYLISGNMSQTGTPTSSDPIQPQECGERTGNLFDLDTWLTDKGISYTRIGSEYTITGNAVLYTQPYYFSESNIDISISAIIETVTADSPRIDLIAADGTPVLNGAISENIAERTGISCAGLRLNWSTNGVFKIKAPMINTGSTALPYEPYGIKIPISSGGENLFDKDSIVLGSLTDNGSIVTNYLMCVSDYIRVNPNTVYTATYLTVAYRGRAVAYYDKNKSFISIGYNSVESQDGTATYTMTTPNNCHYIRVSTYIGSTNHVNELMLNRGSTALPYEPYNRTTTPIYLGEVPTTRRIKKLVLTGEEGWTRTTNNKCYYINSANGCPTDYLKSNIITVICSHYVGQTNTKSGSNEVNEGCVCFFTGGGCEMYIGETTITSAADFKSYLQQQYAAGTPVTVWYVLANETTGIVNEPLRKIGDYADTISMEQAGVQIPTLHGNTVIDVETTLKPSQMYIKYK